MRTNLDGVGTEEELREKALMILGEREGSLYEEAVEEEEEEKKQVWMRESGEVADAGAAIERLTVRRAACCSACGEAELNSFWILICATGKWTT